MLTRGGKKGVIVRSPDPKKIGGRRQDTLRLFLMTGSVYLLRKNSGYYPSFRSSLRSVFPSALLGSSSMNWIVFGLL